MEFELERTGWSGFDPILDTTLRREETLEMIVPDACPDILRVVETDGEVLLTGKEATEGRVTVTGCFKLSALYCPDGERGVRHLAVTIPFTWACEDADITTQCQVLARARLCSADTRALNPRKVLVRAEGAVDVTVYSPRSENLCAGVAGESGVEQLTEQREIYPTLCVKEKPLPLEEEVSLPASRPAAAELLKSRLRLDRGESKLIGNKLIYKGGGTLFLLYRGEDDGVYPFTAELPFSQIMEVAGVAEEADRDMTLSLDSMDCAITGEGRTVSVRGQLRVQAAVREPRAITLLTDAYSTAFPLEVERVTVAAETLTDRGLRTQNVREVWETPQPVREIVDSRLMLGEVTQSREGERLVLTAAGNLRALCVGEDGELFAGQWPVSVPCALDLPEGCRCFARCDPVGDLYAAPAAGGVEARFALDFRSLAVTGTTLTAVAALREGEAPQETGERPSLVLRMAEPGERLWDMAKSCGTTVADIMRANELEDESAGVGKLLLIPRRR